MKAKADQRHLILAVAGTILGIGAISAAITAATIRSEASPDPERPPAVASADGTSIPASSDEAKAYIDRSSEKAEAGDYQAAADIMREAITRFPDDLNLKLNLDFYESKIR